MDTFRKWWNKPKADDQSLLARFYYADRSLTAVASELDSFDGRAEPERCSRLVARLRQGQDQVLSITNVIMDELLGDDRTPRAFRAKFPEEVLQESLAGQLWFGAECLAAGSSIMNREAESAAMRPLAKAVTKSLDNVRNLLREQCLRIKTPNSPTLNLDANDAITETLCESLKIFDRLFAEFELLYVSAMVQVKSKQEHEMQELICVLFSETLQRALKTGHLKQEQVDYFDPALMFSIPRLAIVTGLVIYTKGPLNISMPADHLSEMFRPFRTLLTKIRDLLRTLTPAELFQLEQLLCTNEEINLQNSSYICDDNNKINSDDELVSNVICATAVNKDNNVSSSSSTSNYYGNTTTMTTTVANDGMTTTISVSSTPETISNEWGGDDDKELTDKTLSGDCASGYLIPNTNFGNLLQPNDAPLTDRFISSDDEYISNDFTNVNTGGTSIRPRGAANDGQGNGDSGIGTENTSLDRSPDSEEGGNQINDGNKKQNLVLTGDSKYAENWERLKISSNPSCSENSNSSTRYQSQAVASESSNGGHHHRTTITITNSTTTIDNPSTSQNNLRISSRSGRGNRNPFRKSHSSTYNTANNNSAHHSKKMKSKAATTSYDTSGEDTSSSLSDGDPQEVALALRAAGRLKSKNTENLLHRLFVCIAGVADQLQTNFASDLRQILRSVFLMNMTPPQEEIEVSEKAKDNNLFEFRASENDVIPENGGSNQSIYSAEEVSPESDTVFDLEVREERSSSLETDPSGNGRQMRNVERTRSLGSDSNDSDEMISRASPDQHQHHAAYAGENKRSNSVRERSHSNSFSTGNTNKDIRATRSGDNSPISSSTANSSPIALSRSQHDVRSSSPPHHTCPTATLSRPSEVPPRWVPDDEAPRCMACANNFTTFRRRHHCRNCGGVFCGGCSSSSAPLPKFGLIKAVRVCRSCYVREVGT